jgi:uncharacterized cupredoxin-like copper-binding protein
MRTGFWTGALALGVSFVLTSCGLLGSNPIEVQVILTEYKIESSLTEFSRGVLYQFVITNRGSNPHEWMLLPAGDTDATQAIRKVARDELPPGATVTRLYKFEGRIVPAGDYEFACHVANHYQQGMMLKVRIK